MGLALGPDSGCQVWSGVLVGQVGGLLGMPSSSARRRGPLGDGLDANRSRYDCQDAFGWSTVTLGAEPLAAERWLRTGARGWVRLAPGHGKPSRNGDAIGGHFDNGVNMNSVRTGWVNAGPCLHEQAPCHSTHSSAPRYMSQDCFGGVRGMADQLWTINNAASRSTKRQAITCRFIVAKPG